MPAPFGRREERDGVTCLVVDVEVPQGRETVWEAIATPAGLEPWIGVFEGDPASGRVTFRMTAEGADAPPEPVEIRRCERPLGYDLQVGVGKGLEIWDLALQLDEVEGGTLVTLVHRAHDLAGIDLVGPGWEYYVHRLRAHLAGEPLETVDFADYLPNAAHYAELFEIEPSELPDLNA